MASSTSPNTPDTPGVHHMGAQLSHELVGLGQSPYWDGPQGRDRWNAFIDAIDRAECATYDNLPPKLKRIYDAAARMQGAESPDQQG